MTVRELLARIDSQELSEWMAFFELEPWGAEVDDWRAGLVAATVANTNRDPKKQRKPFLPKDFMPQRRQDPASPQSPEEQVGVMQSWARVWGNKFGDE